MQFHDISTDTFLVVARENDLINTFSRCVLLHSNCGLNFLQTSLAMVHINMSLATNFPAHFLKNCPLSTTAEAKLFVGPLCLLLMANTSVNLRQCYPVCAFATPSKHALSFCSVFRSFYFNFAVTTSPHFKIMFTYGKVFFLRARGPWPVNYT